MTFEDYKTLAVSNIEEEYSIRQEPFFQDRRYDLVAENIEEESIPGKSLLNCTHLLVSFSATDDFIKKELDESAKTALSGFRHPLKNKATRIVRVFVAEKPSYEATHMITSFDFSKTELLPRKSYTEVQAILVDIFTNKIWTNTAGKETAHLFKVVD